MRNARVLGEGTSYYHVMNRVIGRRYLLGDEEKHYFQDLLRRVAKFSGVEVLTYCLMDNHFHLLLKVNEQDGVIPESEVYRRMEHLYNDRKIANLKQRVGRFRDLGFNDSAEEELDRFRVRMDDLPAFVKTLCQRFTLWYNTRNDCCGPFWNDRYKSVLIEPPAYGAGGRNRAIHSDSTLFAMGAYIDLNPVRAGMVKDPKDYLWCGYTAALAGNQMARRGISQIVEARGHRGDWKSLSASYRRSLFAKGEESGQAEDGGPLKRGIPREEVEGVEEAKGMLTLGELLHCRVRVFTTGVVLGSRAFVEEAFERSKDQLGLKRKTGARELGFSSGDSPPVESWPSWCALRMPRGAVIER